MAHSYADVVSFLRLVPATMIAAAGRRANAGGSPSAATPTTHRPHQSGPSRVSGADPSGRTPLVDLHWFPKNTSLNRCGSRYRRRGAQHTMVVMTEHRP
jgi:hypothetical protein